MHQETCFLKKILPETLLAKLCLAFILGLAGMLFIENFIFSESLSLLGFREIDDLAFQSTLRRCHLAIESGHFQFLGRTYDYAYGWFFWIPLAVITYPLFLLSQAGIDWPLIVFPRQLSLAFALGSLVLIYKSLDLLKTPNMAKWTALLFFALLPSFSYFSMRFGTVHMLTFFSCLSIYLALSDTPSTAKGRLKIALCVAATASIKLSGLFIAPIVAGLVWNRMEDKNLHSLFKALWKPVVAFCFALPVLISPALLLAPFNAKILQHYTNMLSHFIGVTHTDSGIPTYQIVYEGLALSSPFLLAAIALLFVGLVVTCLRKRNVDLFLITAGLLLALGYLTLRVKSGYNVYFTPISFLLLFGVQSYSSSRKSKTILLLITALLLSDFIYRSPLLNKAPSPWSAFSYFVKQEISQDRLVKAEKIKKCIDDDLHDQKLGHIFIDHSLPIKINSLTHPTTCISVAWNNLSAQKAYCPKPVDYIIIDQVDAVGALPEEVFNKKLATVGPKLTQNYTQDRATRQELIQTGQFGPQAFSLLCDLEFGMVFRKKQ